MRALHVFVATTDGTREITAYPTATHGLVVHHAVVGCRESEDWMITHARSGLGVPYCWESPDGAGAFAEFLGPICDWRDPLEALRAAWRPGMTTRTWERAKKLGARRHPGPWASGQGIDNGVIA